MERYIWGVSLALLGAWALLEAGFRLAGVPHDVLVYQDSLNPSLRFELKPGAEGMKAGAWVRINSQGLRDREIREEKPDNEFRLVVVGDHPSFGLTVPVEECYARQLEGLLKMPADSKLTTVNLSMYHYNIDQKIEILESRGIKYRPDFVIFQVFPYDWLGLPMAMYPYPRLKNFISSHSFFLRWLMERLFFSRLSHSAVAPPLTQTLPELFRPLKSWLELNHIPGMVVYVPDLSAKGGPASPEAKKMESLYREACRINGLVYHDLSPALSAGPPQSLLWQPTEPFLNALGQRKAAQSISGRLQKFLPRQLSAKKKDKPALRQ